MQQGHAEPIPHESEVSPCIRMPPAAFGPDQQLANIMQQGAEQEGTILPAINVHRLALSWILSQT